MHGPAENNDEKSMSKRPLVSFCIKSYNQKQYIRDALRGAFAQTYSPLEIVISDNHSSDGSDEVIGMMINDYKKAGGKHAIIYNRNSENIGLIRNAEKCYSLAHGLLLLQADGDDISLPDRAEKTVEAWLNRKGGVTGVSSEFFPMAVDGTLKSEKWWKLTIRNPIGASLAYSSVVIKNFPPIKFRDAYDDNVFIRRAYAYGNITWLPIKLVKYRVGSGDTSCGSYASTRQRVSRGMIAAARQNLLDMEYCKGKVVESRRQEIINLAHEIIDSYGVEYGYNPFRKFACHLRACKRAGISAFSLKIFAGFLWRGYPKIFYRPRMVYHWLLSCFGH